MRYMGMFSAFCVCSHVRVHICFFQTWKGHCSLQWIWSLPFLRCKGLTTSRLNHPLIKSTSFQVPKKFEQINITVYIASTHCQPRQNWYETRLVIADRNSNSMDKIWNYLSWHCVYFDFKHALIGFCVWGTSEVINYHSLPALVNATAAFHRGRAGSFVYRERDRNSPLCFWVTRNSQTAISTGSWGDWKNKAKMNLDALLFTSLS